MYDPLILTKVVEERVTKRVNGEVLKSYYRFRSDRWYGGIATADVAGCNLRCKFCWAWRYAWSLKPIGTFLSADEVASRLYVIAKSKGLRQARISGGEPTIGFEHTVEVISNVIKRGLHMVLETNGIVLGANKDYAYMLSEFHNKGIEVRVSIKGTNESEFTLLTNAIPNSWRYQLNALKNLVEVGLEPGVEVYPAVMLSFSSEDSYMRFKTIVRSIHEDLVRSIDEEYVIMYDHVVKLLKRYDLKPKKFFYPGRIPKEYI